MMSIFKLAIAAIGVFFMTLMAYSYATIPSAADEMIKAGEEQMRQGNIDAAISTLNKAVETAPESSFAYTRLGGAYLLKQEYRKGIEAFQTAIGKDHKNASAYGGMGIGYMHLQRYGPARAAFEEMLRIDPSRKAEIEPVMQRIEKRLSAPPTGMHSSMH